jgi:hypothetical protein
VWRKVERECEETKWFFPSSTGPGSDKGTQEGAHEGMVTLSKAGGTSRKMVSGATGHGRNSAQACTRGDIWPGVLLAKAGELGHTAAWAGPVESISFIPSIFKYFPTCKI